MATRIRLDESNFKPSTIVPFKTPDDIPVVQINRTYMDNPGFLPSNKVNLESENEGKVKYLFGQWELVSSSAYGVPGLYEQKLLYVLLSIHQTFKKLGKDSLSFRFKSSYALLRLLGYSRSSASSRAAKERLEKGLVILAHSGFVCKNYYDDRTKTKDNRIDIGAMFSSLNTGPLLGLRMSLNPDFVEWMSKIFTHRIELVSVLDIKSGQSLRMFEILVKNELTFKQKGWWEIRLDNLVDKVGIKGKFKYSSEKIRYLEKAFDNALPALSSNFTSFSDTLKMRIGQQSADAPHKVVFYRSSSEEEATCDLAL